MRLLVVEDDLSISVPLCEGLVREGFEVDLAHSGETALAAGPADLVLLDDLRAEDAARLVERLRTEFGEAAFTAPGGSPFHATFSAGIAMLEAGMGLEQWRQAADDALYASKQAGRDRVTLAPARP